MIIRVEYDDEERPPDVITGVASVKSEWDGEISVVCDREDGWQQRTGVKRVGKFNHEWGKGLPQLTQEIAEWALHNEFTIRELPVPGKHLLLTIARLVGRLMFPDYPDLTITDS